MIPGSICWRHLVASQRESVHLDFSSPAHRSVTQDIPLHNETHRDWKMQAVVCGEGFSGPKVVNVPAGTKACYPLTFHPSAQCIVMGKLSLHNDCDGTEHVFTLRGVGEHPLPVDHVVLRCPVGQTTHTRLDVPNYSQNKVTLKMSEKLDLLVTPAEESGDNQSQQGSSSGNMNVCMTVVEQLSGRRTSLRKIDTQEADKHKANGLGRYEVHYSLEIICEPAAANKVISVQCATQSSVTIEIPVNNSQDELLVLDVYLEGDDLKGANTVSIPPRKTLTYKATFSPGRVGKSTGSVLFHSELVGEFWYQLELYALPPPVFTLPQACCQLGNGRGVNPECEEPLSISSVIGSNASITIPVVNPTALPVSFDITLTGRRHFLQ
ncbi:Cilia- and flagella-associated protein 47 [Larimichthys crocea]|uniref:Uncharacterized protein n=1 Tax=Larimichthys crocea TaxID=215358 RepID=A0ACD3QWC6_LARCR|nr:Cilia- and flagella-associated protein 47 [Larimichthys crocea]